VPPQERSERSFILCCHETLEELIIGLVTAAMLRDQATNMTEGHTCLAGSHGFAPKTPVLLYPFLFQQEPGDDVSFS
jgi:hypothetical protein